jgi:ribosomal-protein-alanine N-acetyltransferase
MSSVAFDPVDAIMEVMEQAFDPAYGEAWNRRQVGDALVMGNCEYLLAAPDRKPPAPGKETAGFTLSRRAADEEELLLIAVKPEYRSTGIGSCLLERLVAESRIHGVRRLFLEMREGNPAELLYRKFGFAAVGRRPKYYNRGTISGIDAITYAIEL